MACITTNLRCWHCCIILCILKKCSGWGHILFQFQDLNRHKILIIASHPPYPVSDTDLKKIIAVLRLAVPYTGIILSTRENAVLRNELIYLGVSQISAGSKTLPGSYSSDMKAHGQFSISDERSLSEVYRRYDQPEDSFQAFAPPAIVPAGLVGILWTWPNPVILRTFASQTRSLHLKSIFWTIIQNLPER